MVEAETGSDDAPPERFTLVGPSPRGTGVESGKTRVTVRGFVTVDQSVPGESPEYIEERVKSEVANGGLFIDGVYPDDDRVTEQLVYEIVCAQADAGRVAVEGWEVVGEDVDYEEVEDGVRVNVASFADLPTEAIVNPSFKQEAADLSAKSLLSEREAELSVLREMGLTYKEAAALMGVTKGTVDKLNGRIKEKEEKAHQQLRRAQVTLDHLSETDAN
jgi:DNA-binding CsgD family transcriptional regulator